jgi:hydrogenase/urease accessory protein HupE
MIRLLLIACALCMACLGPASAHEVRPAYLQIEELPGGEAAVVWKQPMQGDMAIRLQPRLSNGWLEAVPVDQYAAGGYLVRTWRILDARGVAGARLDIDGLKDTRTDVLVRVHRRDLPEFGAVIRPEEPSIVIPAHHAVGSGMAFLALGVEHILSGPDHLLFVLGLLLLVRGRRALLATITSFTVAHSLTLAAATLRLVDVSIPLVETLIAMSILFLAPEVIRARQGGTSLTLRKPWLVAFGFGLLHGIGFATGLTSLELGRVELASALVLFNVGVEIGQIVFVALICVLSRAVQRFDVRWPAGGLQLPAYVIGGLGAFWTLQNAAILFSGSA